MSTVSTDQLAASPEPNRAIMARRAGMWSDVVSVGIRSVRALKRDPEAIVPPLMISSFFYAINIGALQKLAESTGQTTDYKAFQLSTAAIFGVTGISRASALVSDIQSGYFDRLLLTPVRRTALLLGVLVADFVLALGILSILVTLATLIGVRFASGLAGIALYIVMGAVWAVMFAGFSYAVAFKTGNPAAVNSTFLIFFPFGFMTTGFLPKEALTGWLQVAVSINPVTYLLEGLRSLVSTGWDGSKLLQALAAIVGVGSVSLGLAFAALNGRVKRR